MENPKSRKMTNIIILSVILLMFATLAVVSLASYYGKNVKTPFLSIKSPILSDSAVHRSDTVTKSINNITDNSKNLEIKDNHGKIDVKF